MNCAGIKFSFFFFSFKPPSPLVTFVIHLHSTVTASFIFAFFHLYPILKLFFFFYKTPKVLYSMLKLRELFGLMVFVG